MKNNKGFTLIELLAVIVILAILMVAAGAAVISTMNNSKVNTFKDEALQVIDSAKQMYTNESMNESSRIADISDRGGYYLFCVKLDTLQKEGYLEKDLAKYSGYVRVIAPKSNADVKYYIWISNGSYSIGGTERNSISKLTPSTIGKSKTIDEPGETFDYGNFRMNFGPCN